MLTNFIDFAASLQRCKLWQYSNASRLLALIDAEQSFVDANITGFWQNWYDDVFNIDTCNTFGLEVWGLILGVRRPYQDPANYHINKQNNFMLWNKDDKLWHVVYLKGASPQFVVGIQGEELDSRIFVDDETYRLFLKARMFLYNSNGSMADINRYLEFLFPDKAVFATDGYDMSVTVVFYYTPGERDMALINSPDFLPLPAGVQLNTLIGDPKQTFGFDGQELATWADEREKPNEDGYGTFMQ